ncbi:uncharacterized protein LOC111700606 [Eurytemora carolleeae]|uniref:uncharacterized protein LOC111700606 n=1 Tax=Eurytemora carolleeae TaxID=1294199 RepID=UPI000C76E4AF|nr:uncharacterized protein LOC111700606 [Eurytemora carolleeae]|eukprot:XP_023327349.1 uncharacterized protein LOC111700606 [Eurytemora affinis]
MLDFCLTSVQVLLLFRTDHLDCNHLYLDRPNSFEDTGAWNSTAAIQDTWTSSSSSYRPDPGWGIAPLPKSQVAQDDFSSEEDSSSSATPAPMYTVAKKPSQQQSRYHYY